MKNNKNKKKTPKKTNFKKPVDMDKIHVEVKLVTPADKIQIIKDYMDYCVEIDYQPYTIYALNSYEKHLYKNKRG